MVESTAESSTEEKRSDTWEFAEKGRCLIDVDQQTRERILHCMREAETVLKSKECFEEISYVPFCAIQAVMMKLYGHKLDETIMLKPQIQNLYREDLFYADRHI